MKTGRPTKYKKKYAKELIEFFDIDPGIDVEVENSKGVMQSVRHAADFPTKEAFACKIGVHRDTLHEWANAKYENGELKHPEFTDAYKRAEMYQNKILLQNGLKGGYQANFAIFTAKNVLGWRDKVDLEHAGNDKKPLKWEIEIVDPEKKE